MPHQRGSSRCAYDTGIFGPCAGKRPRSCGGLTIIKSAKPVVRNVARPNIIPTRATLSFVGMALLSPAFSFSTLFAPFGFSSPVTFLSPPLAGFSSPNKKPRHVVSGGAEVTDWEKRLCMTSVSSFNIAPCDPNYRSTEECPSIRLAEFFIPRSRAAPMQPFFAVDWNQSVTQEFASQAGQFRFGRRSCPARRWVAEASDYLPPYFYARRPPQPRGPILHLILHLKHQQHRGRFWRQASQLCGFVLNGVRTRGRLTPYGRARVVELTPPRAT